MRGEVPTSFGWYLAEIHVNLLKKHQGPLEGSVAPELICISKLYVLNMEKKNVFKDRADRKATPAKMRIWKALKEDVSLCQYVARVPLALPVSLTWAWERLARDKKTRAQVLKDMSSEHGRASIHGARVMGTCACWWRYPHWWRLSKMGWIEENCLKWNPWHSRLLPKAGLPVHLRWQPSDAAS